MEPSKFLWWQSGLIYQVYPRSFKDSNADGIGDLQGVLSKLDYLKELGVKALWLSPIYPSPMADFGYDISDYKDVHPLFGSLNDLDELIAALHQRDMKIILDLVPNHTSSSHPWFLESRSSKTNPKRNWYIWQDAKPTGALPNNWLAAFGGSAWEWDPLTSQYYYHAFLKEQPDLNWRNPEVQTAMLDVMRFWLDHGVDGFRIDVLWHLIKDNLFRDNPVNPDYKPYMATYDQLLPVYSTDQYEVHDIVKMMRALLDQYNERVMIGEIYLPIHKLVTYYGNMEGGGAHLPFNFQLITLPWNSQQISAAIHEYEGALPAYGWPNWVLGNHDQPRIASRIGREQAANAAMLLLTLRGTPTMYYGDELEMEDVPIPRSMIRDPQGLNMPDKNLSRDPCRTPMQWNTSANAGFTTGEPWLPLSRDFKNRNVEALQTKPDSMLQLYKKLTTLRNNEPSLSVGRYIPVFSDHQLLVYIRQHESSTAFLVILNITHRTAAYWPKDFKFTGVTEVCRLRELEGQKVVDGIDLAGDEGVVIRLSNFVISHASSSL